METAMASRLIQHHDQFFKRLLDKPGTSGALLRERLPPEIAALLSDEPPEGLPGSLVPAALREYRTDRLYRARTRAGRPLLIHVVVEHKSWPDPGTPLQLLGYKTEILQWWVANSDAEPGTVPLPAILSLVVYHGDDPWTAPTSLAEATDAEPSLYAWIVDFHYVLVDLVRTADQALSADRTLRTGFLILKHGRRGGDLRRTLRDLGLAAFALGWDDLVALVRYILQEPNETEAGMLREVLAEIVPGQEERIMSIAAEQWKAEGIAEGLAQGLARGKAEGMVQGEAKGLARGKAESLLRLLFRRFGPVPETLRRQVSTADPESLDRWFDCAIDAPSLDAVFDDSTLH
jgi:predicted transposase YdaD